MTAKSVRDRYRNVTASYKLFTLGGFFSDEAEAAAAAASTAASETESASSNEADFFGGQVVRATG